MVDFDEHARISESRRGPQVRAAEHALSAIQNAPQTLRDAATPEQILERDLRDARETLDAAHRAGRSISVEAARVRDLEQRRAEREGHAIATKAYDQISGAEAARDRAREGRHKDNEARLAALLGAVNARRPSAVRYSVGDRVTVVTPGDRPLLARDGETGVVAEARPWLTGDGAYGYIVRFGPRDEHRRLYHESELVPAGYVPDEEFASFEQIEDEEAEPPDAGCLTRPDGVCVSPEACMHSSPLPARPNLSDPDALRHAEALHHARTRGLAQQTKDALARLPHDLPAPSYGDLLEEVRALGERLSLVEVALREDQEALLEPRVNALERGQAVDGEEDERQDAQVARHEGRLRDLEEFHATLLDGLSDLGRGLGI